MDVGFRLVNIKNNQFAFDDIEIEEESLNDISVSINAHFGIHPEQRIVGCIIKIYFEYKKNKFVFLETECHFQLSEETWNGLVKKNQLIIPLNLLQHFGVITFGTMRGILFEKLQGSDIEFIQLPLINLTEVITEEEVFELI